MSFDLLYKKYCHIMRHYINRHVWNVSVRHDVEQETWIAISKRWEEYKSSRPFLPWAKGFFLNARRDVTKQEVCEAQLKKDYRDYLEFQTHNNILNIVPDWLVEGKPELYTLFLKHYVEKDTLLDIAKTMSIDYNEVRRMNVRLRYLLKEHHGKRNK